MDVFGLCSFIVAWRFGGAGFMFVYVHMVSFCMMFLHCFSVHFMVFWQYCVVLLLITVNLLSCRKLFTLCSYSSCVSIAIAFLLSVFVMVSLFVDTLFFVCYWFPFFFPTIYVIQK
jgi:hypothetical protein